MTESGQQQACLICSGSTDVIAHAIVAPFICELADLAVPTPTALRECRGCDVSFFEVRYSDAVMEALYGGYRSDRYFSVRKKWEPWYSKNVNEAYSNDSDAVSQRVDFAGSILARAQADRDFQLIVDFGGDEGQFIPPWPDARRVVCEVSDKELPAGVERIRQLSDLGADQPDLVIIAHVLEHLNDPLATLIEIRKSLADDGVLYVEVPLDRPRVKKWHASPAYERTLGRASKRRATLLPLDFAGGVTRQLGIGFPRAGALKSSEHINYFSEKSITKLLEAAGFDVLLLESDPKAKVGALRLGRLGVAARPALSS